MKILIVEPNQYPYMAEIENNLSAMQGVVEGLIECVAIEEGVDIVCNEEGKINGLPLNRSIENDIIAGTFFVVGYNDNGEHVSLTDEQFEKYSNMFHEPEQFVGMFVEEDLELD